MSNQKHVLLETKQGKKLITLRRNIAYLKEFIELFEVKMSLVKLKKGKVLTLEELAKNFCDHINDFNYEYTLLDQNINYEDIKKRKSEDD